jgi:hypothetical protein
MRKGEEKKVRGWEGEKVGRLFEVGRRKKDEGGKMGRCEGGKNETHNPQPVTRNTQHVTRNSQPVTRYP